ncbi:MAG: DNA (cytosine-5-)-methyltransferase [Candidatus Thorarchaeota archaeon]
MTSISLAATDLELNQASKMLYNHICSTLSALDVEIIESVPEGGNWQDIPLHVIRKSARLTQISNSGGRTTYYGRLSNSLPSYTVNTYFNRPGNGTFVHPVQNRLISMREAARLQSFTDRFRFLGSYSSRYKQIGNAVPPLLARAVASLFKPGRVIDLFSGAGGLSDGFVQASHDVLLATDFNSNMCKTYSYNHSATEVIQADLLKDEQLIDLLDSIERSLSGKHLNSLIGGPPCQGFSTAGNRDKLDSRNTLVFRMLRLIQQLAPENVVIENVLGLKWMQHGKVLCSIVEALEEEEYAVTVFTLKAEEFGVPQRRRRVFIIGRRNQESVHTPTGILASLIRGKTRSDIKLGSEELPPPVSVSEAISDLPPLNSGGGTDLAEYDASWTETDYQRYMRGSISFDEFIKKRTEQC